MFSLTYIYIYALVTHKDTFAPNTPHLVGLNFIQVFKAPDNTFSIFLWGLTFFDLW